MALIMNYKRNADARALALVEMCVLKRDHFQRTLIRYAEDRNRVLTRILTSTMVNKNICKLDSPLKETWSGLQLKTSSSQLNRPLL